MGLGSTWSSGDRKVKHWSTPDPLRHWHIGDKEISNTPKHTVRIETKGEDDNGGEYGTVLTEAEDYNALDSPCKIPWTLLEPNKKNFLEVWLLT